MRSVTCDTSADVRLVIWTTVAGIAAKLSFELPSEEGRKRAALQQGARREELTIES